MNGNRSLIRIRQALWQFRQDAKHRDVVAKGRVCILNVAQPAVDEPKKQDRAEAQRDTEEAAGSGKCSPLVLQWGDWDVGDSYLADASRDRVGQAEILQAVFRVIQVRLGGDLLAIQIVDHGALTT